MNAFEKLEDGVKISFEDGTSAAGTLVVGADGPHSQVRTCLLGDEVATPTPFPLVHCLFGACYGDAEKSKMIRKPHPIFYGASHPNGNWCYISILAVPPPNDPATWKFQLMFSWLGDKNEAAPFLALSEPERLALLKEKASEFAEPFKSAVQWIPEGTRVVPNELHYWKPVPWNNQGGRITLAGDACHPLTPHRGQGLNHCVADVAKLIEGLTAVRDGKGPSQADAIALYEKEMIERGKNEVESSVENTTMLHTWDKLMQSALVTSGFTPKEAS